MAVPKSSWLCCHSCPLWAPRDQYEVLDLFFLPVWSCSLSVCSPLSFHQGIGAVISSRPTSSHPHDPLHSEKKEGNSSLTQNLWTVRLSEGLPMNCVLQRENKTRARFIGLQSCHQRSPSQHPQPKPHRPSSLLSPAASARLATLKPDRLLLQREQEKGTLSPGFTTWASSLAKSTWHTHQAFKSPPHPAAQGTVPVWAGSVNSVRPTENRAPAKEKRSVCVRIDLQVRWDAMCSES